MINDVITYLQANCTSFNSITYAEESEPVTDHSSEAPALFVSDGDEDADENTLITGVSQLVHLEVVILMVAPLANMDALRTELMSAMLNHQLSSEYDPFTISGAEKKQITGGYSWKEFIFSTAKHERSV